MRKCKQLRKIRWSEDVWMCGGKNSTCIILRPLFFCREPAKLSSRQGWTLTLMHTAGHGSGHESRSGTEELWLQKPGLRALWQRNVSLISLNLQTNVFRYGFCNEEGSMQDYLTSSDIFKLNLILWPHGNPFVECAHTWARGCNVQTDCYISRFVQKHLFSCLFCLNLEAYFRSRLVLKIRAQTAR
jgi:hypothetical protein